MSIQVKELAFVFYPVSDIDAAIGAELGRFRGIVSEHVGRWLVRFAVNRIARDFERYQDKSSG